MTDFSPAVKAQFDHWIAKYPTEQKQSAILPVLRIAQEENGGWLSDEIMQKVADYLQLPLIAVYEVATFYSMYELKPVGKYKLSVCTNISCMLSDCDKIVKHLKTKLGIDFNQTTADGRFTLKEVECLGACTTAPVMHVGHRYYRKLTPEKIDEILDGLK